MSRVLNAAILHHKAEIAKLERQKEEIKEKMPFMGFVKGDSVLVGEPKNPIIYSYGKREGFPSEIIGKKGVVIGFDRKTLSSLKIKIEVAGKVYVGNPEELKHDSTLSI